MSDQASSGSLSRRQFASLLFAGGITAALPVAGPALAAPATLRGTIFYRERIALSPNAVVTVRLEDVSRAGAPARVIAETQTRAGRNQPISWTLRYNDVDIDPRRRYGLRAEIREGDRLMFVTDSWYPVFGATNETTDLMVVRAPAPSGPPDRDSQRPGQGRDNNMSGRWSLEQMEGERLRGRNLPELDIDRNGRVSGSTGCNRITGEVRTGRREASFGRMASTRMACDPGAMRREQRFLSLLERTSGFDLENRGSTLVLLDRRNREILRFSRR